MKQITLNQDGVLNIMDPRKTYIVKSTDLDDNSVIYSTPYMENRSGQPHWIFKEINPDSVKIMGRYCITRYGYRYLQYLLDNALRDPYNSAGFKDELYQFDSLQEFQDCHKEGLI